MKLCQSDSLPWWQPGFQENRAIGIIVDPTEKAALIQKVTSNKLGQRTGKKAVKKKKRRLNNAEAGRGTN